jgi:hypothetical protein
LAFLTSDNLHTTKDVLTYGINEILLLFSVLPIWTKLGIADIYKHILSSNDIRGNWRIEGHTLPTRSLRAFS